MVENLVTDPLKKALVNLGWEEIEEDWWQSPSGKMMYIRDEELLALIDYVYMNGCHFGIQRVLYENETMEDCEKDDADLIAAMRELHKTSTSSGNTP